jgi:hypothetical protein
MMRRRREELSRNDAAVKEVIKDGARRASQVAKKTMQRVRSAVGLL